MSVKNKSLFLEQLDHVLELYKTIDGLSHYSDFSDIPFNAYGQFHASAIAVINRVAGPDSTYTKDFNNLPMHKNHSSNNANIPVIAGIVQALRDDVARDFLEAASELIHGELFGDFLEMANHLLDEGYKDAAAVIAGGVLETHLRQLCAKHSISIDEIVNNQTRSKRADRLNNDLAGSNVYSKLDQKECCVLVGPS